MLRRYLKGVAFSSLVTVGLVVVTVGVAAAEAVISDSRTAIRARPGEQARIVVRVDPGERMQVRDREGRWIQVEYEGQTGWVTRTSVRAAGGDEAGQEERQQRQREERRQQRQREERRQQRQREERRQQRRARGDGDSGFGRRGDDGQEMRVAVSAERAQVHVTPDPGSDVVVVAQRGDELRALDRRGQWFRVRSSDGDGGWIAANAVGDPTSVAGARPEGDGDDGDAGPPPAAELEDSPDADDDAEVSEADAEAGLVVDADGPSARAGEPELRVGIAAAGTSLDLDYGGDPPARAAAFASGVGLTGAVIYPVSGPWEVGADLRYLAQLGVSDLSFELDGDDVEGSNFFLYDFDVGALARYASDAGAAAWTRVGFHYNSVFVRDLQNDAELPREELYGLTAGLGVDIPVTDDLQAELAGTAMLASSLRQTAGISDGEDVEGARAVWASIGTHYTLSEGRGIDIRYRLGRHANRWSGESGRISGAADLERRDIRHQFLVGATASF